MGDLQGLGMSQRFATAMDSNCALKNIMCNPADIYRQPNGVCNNLKNPMWGSSITPQPRFIPPHYGDGKYYDQKDFKTDTTEKETFTNS